MEGRLMTREDTKGLLMTLMATYPNFKIEDKTATINAWHMFLEPYTQQQIIGALKIYATSNNSGFAPSVSQLLSLINKPSELSEMTEAEAWSLVSKAIRRSAYYSNEEFEKLPEEVQKAVGSPTQLFNWAIDEDYNEGVVMSLFQRNYRTVLQRKRDYNMLPPDMRLEVNNPNLIEMR